MCPEYLNLKRKDIQKAVERVEELIPLPTENLDRLMIRPGAWTPIGNRAEVFMNRALRGRNEWKQLLGPSSAFRTGGGLLITAPLLEEALHRKPSELNDWSTISYIFNGVMVLGMVSPGDWEQMKGGE